MENEQLLLNHWSQLYFYALLTAVQQNSCSEFYDHQLSRETILISLVMEILCSTFFLELLPFLILPDYCSTYVGFQLHLMSAAETSNI